MGQQHSHQCVNDQKASQGLDLANHRDPTTGTEWDPSECGYWYNY